MLFTEPAFLFAFLPALLLVYFLSPRSWQNHVLTLFSLFFYAIGEWQFLPWLLGSTAVNYFVALGLDAWKGTRRARVLLALGICVDLSLLLVFKYAGFLTRNLNEVLALVHLRVPVPRFALPLGISFFTFHKISYKIDVARGVAEVRRDPLDLLLYILLFPQLIAGPIVRYHDIAAELVRRTVTRAEFAGGVRRFVIGLGKKMLVANTVALAADRIFALPNGQLTTGVAWLGVVCYTLHIYFDFSGYSDMAIGLARMFGFHFLENFDFPYIARSITEFWRRWHVSLSRWFRDYLYIPLGGNRASPGRTYFNLVVVFFLCGLWHGASWTFVVWGLFHGGVLVIERLGLSGKVAALPRPLAHAYTLLLVMIGWVLFRAESLGQAGAFLRAMAGGGARSAVDGVGYYLDPGVALAIAVGVVGSTPWLPAAAAAWARWRERATRGVPLLGQAATDLAAHVALAGVFVLSILRVASGTYNPFIYFRF